jgi:flavin-binding protein dodecin
VSAERGSRSPAFGRDAAPAVPIACAVPHARSKLGWLLREGYADPTFAGEGGERPRSLREGPIGDRMCQPGQRPGASRVRCLAREETMTESLYKVIEIIGTSPQSWDIAAKNAVERAAKTVRELRVAEVVEQDIEIRNGKLELYRVKLKVSFKFDDEDRTSFQSAPSGS